MKKSISIFAAAILMLLLPLTASAAARDTIKIVGSSTVYPFATVVAERFGKSTKFNTPVIESTGSGGGLKLFCKGIGVEHPDITNASRRIKQKEIDNCAKAGVTDIIEIKIGYDGIVIANSKKADVLALTKRQIFLALAPEIPHPNGAKQLIKNPNVTWRDVDSSLPNIKIEVLGPPPTSGTRDAFAELAMEGGCKTFKWLKDIKKENKKRYKAICRSVREDGPYIEAGENDNLIVQKLNANPNALGVFGYSFLIFSLSTIMSGAIFPFSASPQSWVMRAWAFLATVGEADSPAVGREAITPTRRSTSSTPMRHFTVTGIVTADCMAVTHAATSGGSFIRQAPKEPDCTLGLGQPTLRLISSKPNASPRRAARDNKSGSQPPNCNATGLSSACMG